MAKSATYHAVLYQVLLSACLCTFVCGNTTTSGYIIHEPAKSLAVIQMIDSTGAVTKEVTTNDNVRLRIKALTSTEYYTPLVDKCWYGPLRLSGEDRWEDRAKLTTVAKKGCGTAWPLKAEKEGFLDNGPQELLTSLFSLSPLHQVDFSYTEFTCEIVICLREQNCSLTCPHKRDGDFREAPDARRVNVSVVIYVQKVAATTKSATERSDGIQIGPDLARKQGETESSDRKSFLKENHPYLLLATLGAVTLTLICSLFLGYKYIANANRKRANKKAELVSRDQTGVKFHVVSPPPIYSSKEGLWMTPESCQSNPRYPLEEERCMMVHPVKTPRHYDDRCDVMVRSPPGGELFPEARLHGRSPVSLSSDGNQRIRSRGTDEREIVGAALKEYFENRGLNL